jgi:hypothetical protein
MRGTINGGVPGNSMTYSLEINSQNNFVGAVDFFECQKVVVENRMFKIINAPTKATASATTSAAEYFETVTSVFMCLTQRK